MKLPSTPFPTSGYYGPEYFCDRVSEANTLLTNIKAGHSTVITSIRRMGKTGLVKHVLSMLPSDYQGIYIDILPCESLVDFFNSLTTSVLNTFPEKTGIGNKLWSTIKSLRPVVTYDPLTGLPQFSFDLKTNDSQKNISLVFSILES